jgi:hypothetical protein
VGRPHRLAAPDDAPAHRGQPTAIGGMT